MKNLFTFLICVLPFCINAQKFEGNVLAGLQMSNLIGEETFGYHFGIKSIKDGRQELNS